MVFIVGTLQLGSKKSKKRPSYTHAPKVAIKDKKKNQIKSSLKGLRACHYCVKLEHLLRFLQENK